MADRRDGPGVDGRDLFQSRSLHANGNPDGDVGRGGGVHHRRSGSQRKNHDVTGTVGDAMCGTKHMMAGDEAGCTRACVQKGSDYALIVKEKVYKLKANDAAKADLDKLAGKTAKVVGDLNGDTIQVSSVQAAR